MKRHIYLFAAFIIAAIFTACDKTNDIPDDPYAGLIILNKDNVGAAAVTSLVANNTVTVGEVALSVSGENLTVTFKVTKEGYMLSMTNLAVGTALSDIPQTGSGNPVTDDFEYSTVHNPSVLEYTYSVPKGELSTVVAAAHAYVVSPTGEESCLPLVQLQAIIPTSEVTTTIVNTMATSRYDLTLSGAGDLSGEHKAWCSDTNPEEADFNSARLISSYSTTYDMSKAVITPSHLPHLNYLMNKYSFTYGYPVVQAAVWRIMNGSFVNHTGSINLTPGEMTQYETITTDALVNGGSYVPGAGDYLVVLVKAGDMATGWTVFFLYKKCTPVYQEDIAWGMGQSFPGNSWARYFGFRVK